MAIIEAGAPALHFTLPGLDGREYTLPNSLDGRPLLLVFFKTTCGTCDLAFPYVNRLRDAYAGLAIWAVSQDPAERAGPYARDRGMDYPVLIDAPAYEVSRLYDPPATPALFLADGRGRIAYTAHGFAKVDLNAISAIVAGCLGQEPVVVAREGDGQPDFQPG
jgi:peroxiredoxin